MYGYSLFYPEKSLYLCIPIGKMMFRIQEYGRTELAQLYCPDIAPESAWKKLKSWIALHPGLPERLQSLGYNGHTRSFTPAQVEAIVHDIGEP